MRRGRWEWWKPRKGPKERLRGALLPPPPNCVERSPILAVLRKDDVIYTVGDVMRGDTLSALMFAARETRADRAIN